MAYKISVKEKGKGGIEYGRTEATKEEAEKYSREARMTSKKEGFKAKINITKIDETMEAQITKGVME